MRSRRIHRVIPGPTGKFPVPVGCHREVRRRGHRKRLVVLGRQAVGSPRTFVLPLDDHIAEGRIAKAICGNVYMRSWRQTLARN